VKLSLGDSLRDKNSGLAPGMDLGSAGP